MVGPGAGQVLVVGSVNVDHVVRLERLPSAGETVTGGAFERHHGGKGANQAVAAARLGAEVAFVGAVGNDDAGRAALEALRGEPVDVERCLALDGASTGVALIVVDASGENQIAVAPGANWQLTARHVVEALTGFRMEGGVFLAGLEVPDEAVLAGAGWAARAGLTVVINPAPARPLSPDLLALRPLLALNEGEAQALAGVSDGEEAAHALAGRTGAPVVVTLGATGALLLEGEILQLVPAPSVDVVDSTGAGDTFAGALVAELANGSSVAEAVRFAVAAAALSVGAAGARRGMPRRAAVEAFRAGRAEWDSNPGHVD